MASAVCSHVQILLISIVVFVPFSFSFFFFKFRSLCEYVMENLKIIHGIRELGRGLWLSIVRMILYFSFSIVKVLRFWLMIEPAWRISVLIIVAIVVLKIESRLGSKFSPMF